VLPLRYPKFWLVLGWALVGGVCLGSVLPAGALEVLDDLDLSDEALHAGSYFLLMVWFAGLYDRRYHPLIALTLLGLGFALELLQGRLGYRDFDLFDMLANGAGIAAGMALSVWLFEGWCQRVEERFLARGSS
jgi:hypothetical protein